MNNTIKIFGALTIFAILVGLVSYKVTYALFSDTATSTNNTFTAAAQFPTPTPVPHIVINEVYSDGQAKGEWVELYNQTSSPIDVSGWKISDKNAFDTGQDDTFPTVSQIPAGGFAVIITNQSTAPSIPGSAITIELSSANIGSGLNDDGDTIVLKNSLNQIIDSMSYGNDTSIFALPPSAPTTTQSLIRNPSGIDTNTASDWQITNTLTIGITN